MIKALLVELEDANSGLFEKYLLDFYPQISLDTTKHDPISILNTVENDKPDLIFFELTKADLTCARLFFQLNLEGVDYVIVSPNQENAYEAIRFNATGFVLKPIDPIDFLNTLQRVIKNITRKRELESNRKLLQKLNTRLSNNDKIGIPTMDGFDFVRIEDIVRCEAMQRCTLVITENRKSIVSSYNLGEFRKLLEPFGFFSSHKSHLINLNHIREYSREGSILMNDHTSVPVSRRKRGDFLKVVHHI